MLFMWIRSAYIFLYIQTIFYVLLQSLLFCWPKHKNKPQLKIYHHSKKKKKMPRNKKISSKYLWLKIWPVCCGMFINALKKRRISSPLFKDLIMGPKKFWNSVFSFYGGLWCPIFWTIGKRTVVYVKAIRNDLNQCIEEKMCIITSFQWFNNSAKTVLKINFILPTNLMAVHLFLSRFQIKWGFTKL